MLECTYIHVWPVSSLYKPRAYGLSWDLVEWIATHEIPRNLQKGAEDWMVGEWMLQGNKVINYVDQYESFPSGVGDIHDLKTKRHMIWFHNLKDDLQILDTQLHMLTFDNSSLPRTSYIDPFSKYLEDTKKTFRLEINETHCLDTIFYFSFTAQPCTNALSQKWLYKNNGAIYSPFRDKCLDIDGNSYNDMPQSARIILYHCSDSINQAWIVLNGRIRSKEDLNWVLLFRSRENHYTNTNLALEMFEIGSKQQKWFKLPKFA